MFTQMRSQCIRKCHAPKATGIRRRIPAGGPALLAAVLSGAFTSAASAQIAATGPTALGASSAIVMATSQAEPTWNYSLFIECLRRIWESMGGDPGVFASLATTPDAAMTLVISQYDLVGTPTYLSPQEQMAFMQDMSNAACELRQRPANVNEATSAEFLKVVTSMWIDLGGYPGDLGC
jgi:hypothetical protein